MTFYLLAVSIICVFPYCKITLLKQPLWRCFLVLSLISALYQNVIDLRALLSITLLCALYYYSITIQQRLLRTALTVVFIVISLALALHWLPGFNNLPVVINEHITKDAIAFTLYANFDKAVAGLFLCAYFYSTQKYGLKPTLITTKNNTLKPFIIIISTILVTITAALILGLVNFSPKIPDFWLAFLAINLLFTCVAEEALFRGIIQTKLSQIITHSRFTLLAPVVTAFVFALAHIAGGTNYVMVSFIAGFGYSYIFYKTQRLEWAILCHWLVNICHLFLFTYPMLDKS